mmetsp:Transcript_21422/g.31844  ORF Transcript_21422/g.31844 Transcript_21422/m.31844 type:complete len:203 (-) Transcript_21422:344-952(-)
MGNPSESELREKLFEILGEVDLEKFTKKQARKRLEEEFGLEKDTLKLRKKEINKYLAEYLAEREEEEEKDVAESKEEDEKDDGPPPLEDAEPPRKKAKRETKTEAKEKEKNHWVETRSGNKAPGKLKDRQSNAMSKEAFLAKAGEVTLELFGNKIGGRGREFTSGNMGWYLGGKIEIPIGKKTLWGQVGVNITIPGSKEWED